MALRTRVYYAEQVINQLQNAYPNRDWKIDLRDVYPALDNWINAKAKDNLLESMQMNIGMQVDEQFITTFENLTITDPAGKQPSFVPLPANYAALPNNMGIQDVFFMNNSAKKKYFDPIYISSYKGRSEDRYSMAYDNQGRLEVFIQNGNLVFSQGNVGATYGTCGIRQVIKSAFDINNTAPYPIPADLAEQMISDIADWFMNRREQQPDVIRDNNDKP